MCLKCTKKVTNPLALVNLIDDDFKITSKFCFFAINIMKEVCGVLELFLSFLKGYEKKNIPQDVMINVKTQISLHQNIASMTKTYCD